MGGVYMTPTLVINAVLMHHISESWAFLLPAGITKRRPGAVITLHDLHADIRSDHPA